MNCYKRQQYFLRPINFICKYADKNNRFGRQCMVLYGLLHVKIWKSYGWRCGFQDGLEAAALFYVWNMEKAESIKKP